MSQRLNFSIELGKQADNQTSNRSGDLHLTFVVLGCFAGAQDSGNLLGKPKVALHRIDQNNFESFFSQLNPSLRIDLAGLNEPLLLTFDSLEDFHPDQLYKQLSLLDADIDRSNQNPSQEISDQNQPSADNKESNQQTLSRLLGEGSLSSSPGNSSVSQGKSALIESIVGRLVDDSLQKNGHAQNDLNPEQPNLHESVAELVRTVLHHPDFQALESHWRGLDWLLRNLESDDLDEMYVLNLDYETWDIYSQQNLDIVQTDLYKSLQGRFSDRPSSEEKLILICDKQITPISKDIYLLEKLGQIAESLDALLFAGADNGFIPTEESDTDDLAEWAAFQSTQIANRVSLVLPRMLMRLPYGKEYDPVDAFSFEELGQKWSAADLLWGCPSYALAIVLAIYNRSTNPQDASSLTDCPAFAYRSESETYLQPCTEHLFKESQLAAILDLGLVPIIGSRRSNLVKLPWHPQL
ncbi:MAG: type VI secretion system contractile sheath large subunit [Candidatus Thiodiazotropha sp. LLP2]